MSFANREQAVYFSGGTPEASVDTTPHAPGLLGQIVTYNSGTAVAPVWKQYQYVKASAAIATCYAPLVWTDSSSIGYSVKISDVTVNTAAFYFAGWSSANAAIAANQYFWMLVYNQPKPFIGTLGFNIASNATADSGLFYQLSAGSMASVVTTWGSANITMGSLIVGPYKGPIASLLSSIETCASGATTNRSGIALVFG